MVACISTMPLDSEVVDGKGTDGPEPVTVTDTPDGEYVIPPEELAGEFEGDMVLTDEQTINLMSKTGLINTKYRWPNAVIPYVIGYEYSEYFNVLLNLLLIETFINNFYRFC